jgi:DNA polymerase-3 subunit gamma/tau
MSDSQVIARRFRPQSFDQVIGQEAITRTLMNSLRSGRIHHAYLFTGARGVGKTTTARILAKCLNCIKGVTTEPCGQCPSCVEIAASRSIDVIEIDAASNTSVENVRNVIINTVAIAPARDRYKIFIIDEVHMLSGSAFNALLKTLEEPPPRIVFILATTELQKVPETILSRCQVFEFRTITIKKVVAQLRRIADEIGVKISDSALMAVARAGEGSMRDAESALDQVISFSGNEVADEDVIAALGLVDVETLNSVIDSVARQDAARMLAIVEEVVSRGYDLRNFCRELMAHVRALLVIKVAGFDPEILQTTGGEGQKLSQLAELFSEQDLVRFFSILTRTEQDVKTSSQPRFQLEIGLIKLIQAGRLYLLEDLIRQFEDVQSKLSGGSPIAPPQPKGSSSSTLRNASEKVRLPQPPKPLSSAGQQVTEPGASVQKPSEQKAYEAVKEPVQPQADAVRKNPPPQVKEAAPPAYLSEPPRFDPPPMIDSPPPEDPFEGADLPLMAAKSSPAAAQQSDEDKIKSALEAKGKMLLLSKLDHATSIVVDGDFLRIVFPANGQIFKRNVETKENIKAIEEVCREALGRQLQVSVTAGAEPQAVSEQPARSKVAAKPGGEEHPTIRAIAEKFRGQVEIIKRES